MNKKIVFLLIFQFFLVFLLNFEFVSSLGISQPVLIGHWLPRGETGKIAFRISNMGSTTDMTCSYSVEGLDPLTASFDETQVNVKGGEEKRVEGRVRAPLNAPIQTYSGTLRVSCSPVTTLEGTGAAISSVFVESIDVSVVAERPTTTTVPEEKPIPAISTSAILTIIILVVIIGIGYWIGKKSKK